LILTLLLPRAARARDDGILKHICLADRSTYRIEYSGLLGLAFDECVRFLAHSWRECLDQQYFYGDPGDDDGCYWDWVKQIDYLCGDYQSGRWSDARRYWWHHATDWGPIETYIVGRPNDVLDWGPIRVTGKFKFRLKHYEAQLASCWNFRFKPRIDLSSEIPFVKKLCVSTEFVYHIRGKKMMSIEAEVGISVERRDLYAWVGVSLANW
jgi:hypothetical protein